MSKDDGTFSLLPVRTSDGDVLTIASPMWLEGRIFFVSDITGCGNLHSVDEQGGDLQQHTQHSVYYARNPHTDGHSIVYHCGGDLYRYNLVSGLTTEILFSWPGPRAQLRFRTISSPASYLDLAMLHPNGHSIAFLSRGRLFDMPLWQGPAMQTQLEQQIIEFAYLSDGRLLMIALPFVPLASKPKLQPTAPEPQIYVQRPEITHQPNPLFLDFAAPLKSLGYPEQLCANPDNSLVAVANHRLELILLRLQDDHQATATLIDTAPYTDGIQDVTWSPDGRL